MWEKVPQCDGASPPALKKRDLCECALIRPPLHTHTLSPPSLKDPLKKRRKGWDQETPTGEFKSISTNR